MFNMKLVNHQQNPPRALNNLKFKMPQDNLEKLAHSYCKLLNSIDWSDEIIVNGLKEGINKFLSNASIYLNKGSKYEQGDFYSPAALSKINNKHNDIIYEHMILKNKYIQQPCIKRCQSSKSGMNFEFAYRLISKYWKIAIITKEEDAKLRQCGLRNAMPENWDGNNIFSRYEAAGIQLISAKEIHNYIHKN